MGCTEKEFISWIPGAVGDRLYDALPGSVDVAIDSGRAVIAWQAMAPRRIALVSIPRLLVTMRFEGLSEAQIAAFLKRFDLYTMRGGG